MKTLSSLLVAVIIVVSINVAISSMARRRLPLHEERGFKFLRHTTGELSFREILFGGIPGEVIELGNSIGLFTISLSSTVWSGWLTSQFPW